MRQPLKFKPSSYEGHNVLTEESAPFDIGFTHIGQAYSGQGRIYRRLTTFAYDKTALYQMFGCLDNNVRHFIIRLLEDELETFYPGATDIGRRKGASGFYNIGTEWLDEHRIKTEEIEQAIELCYYFLIRPGLRPVPRKRFAPGKWRYEE